MQEMRQAWTSRRNQLRKMRLRKMNFFFSSRRRHTISKRDWSSDVCSSDLLQPLGDNVAGRVRIRTFHALGLEIGRASCRERGVVFGGHRKFKKKTYKL